MNWFDIIVLIILLGAFIKGMRKGLAMQLAGFVAIIIGAIFAGKAAEIILPYILDVLNISANIAVVLSYALAFVIIVFGIKLIGKMLHNIIEALHIGFVNKILGAVLGVITASLVLSILVNLTIMLDAEEGIITNRIKAESLFYSSIQKTAPTIVPYLKEEVWEKHIQDKLNKNDEEEEYNKQNSTSTDHRTNQLKI